MIIDLHSYPVVASDYGLYKESAIPALCLGVDDFHASEALVALATSKVSGLGDIDINTLFVGTCVPLEVSSKDARVQSIMLEFRKDTFLTGVVPGASFEKTALAISKFIDAQLLS